MSIGLMMMLRCLEELRCWRGPVALNSSFLFYILGNWRGCGVEKFCLRVYPCAFYYVDVFFKRQLDK